MKKTAGIDAGNEIVTIDRRREDRRDEARQDASGSGRRKTPRRRQIDPTTCERDYSDNEIEFMRAMDEYKRAAGRMFPTCSEVLEVIRSLGYVKLDEEQRAMLECEEFHGYEPDSFVDDEDEEQLETEPSLSRV